VFGFSGEPDAAPAESAPSEDELLHLARIDLFDALRAWRHEIVVRIDGIELGRTTISFFDQDPGDFETWLFRSGAGQFGNAVVQSRADRDRHIGATQRAAPVAPDATPVWPPVNQIQQEQASVSGITTIASEDGPHVKALPSIGFSTWPQQASGSGVSYATAEGMPQPVPL
jgi:hypothetical protein